MKALVMAYLVMTVPNVGTHSQTFQLESEACRAISQVLRQHPHAEAQGHQGTVSMSCGR